MEILTVTSGSVDPRPSVLKFDVSCRPSRKFARVPNSTPRTANTLNILFMIFPPFLDRVGPEARTGGENLKRHELFLRNVLRSAATGRCEEIRNAEETERERARAAMIPR